jgi:hypothetical protein
MANKLKLSPAISHANVNLELALQRSPSSTLMMEAEMISEKLVVNIDTADGPR